MLDVAIRLAAYGHQGQTRWNGTAYILHPLRVMNAMQNDQDRMVGVLHDVLEDTPITVGQLSREGIPVTVIEAVVALTHLPHEPYEAYLKRIAENAMARRVKLVELRDNMDLSQVPTEMFVKYHERSLPKYYKAYRFLGELV